MNDKNEEVQDENSSIPEDHKTIATSKQEFRGEDGSEVILTADGGFFQSIKVANQVIKQKKLPSDKWEARQFFSKDNPRDDQWYIAMLGTNEVPEDAEPIWWVKFSNKTDRNSQNDVVLSVNGETLIIQRGIEVPVPERFLHCADNATYTLWKKEPGGDRQFSTEIQTFPYQRVKQGQMSDYKKYKSTGELAKKKIKDHYGEQR